MTTPDPFAPGYRLTDGNQLNTEIANPSWSITDSISATPGGTMLTSAKVTNTITNVTAASASGAGLTLPQAIMGRVLVVANNTNNDIRIFAEGDSTINNLAGQIGILLQRGTASIYTAIATKQWEQLNFTATNVVNGIINVKDFGASGNGTSDDSGSIQAAVNFANSQGGGIVYFPPGTYAIASYINGNNKNNITYQGAGAGDSIIKLQNGATLPTLIFALSVQDVTIAGLGFDLNAAAASPGAAPAIALSSVNNCVVQNCKIYNFPQFGLEITGVNYKVLNNYFKIYTPLTTGTWSIWSGSTPNQDATFEGNYLDGAHLAVLGSNLNILNNHIVNFEYGAGIVTYADPNCFNITISGNICHSEHATIDSDITVQSGMELNSYNTTVTGNICYRNSGSGIVTSGRNCVISNNICFDNNLYRTVNPAYNSPGIATYSHDLSLNTDASGTLISNNKCFDTIGPSGNQAYGYVAIHAVAVLPYPIFVTNNDFDGNRIGPVLITQFRPGDVNYIGETLFGSFAYTPSPIAAGGFTQTTLTLPSAQIGDLVTVNYSQPTQGLIITGWVASANQIGVTLFNPTSFSITLPAGNLSVTSTKNENSV